MAAEEEPDSLKLYWEHFFKSETGTYEKSTWLDLFLAEFLVRVNEGAKPKDLIKFCPVSGVVTLVGCELLCGLHRVTSSINAHCAPPLPGLDAPCSARDAGLDADEDPPPPDLEAVSDAARMHSSSLFTRTNALSSSEILRKYLLGGVAWRCLALLKALGVEGLSCCRQLSSVLIWAFGELCATSTAPASAQRPARRRADLASRTPMHQLFSNKIWSKQKPLGGPGCKGTSANSSEKGSVTGRSRHTGQMKMDTLEKAKRKSAKDSEQSSETGDSDNDLQALNRSLAIRVSSPADDFGYFDSPVRAAADYPSEPYADPYYSPRKTKPRADDYMTDKHRDIINSEISSFEFILMITDLLQELCKAESSLSGSEGSQISVQCINFSLRNLCSLQFSSGANLIHNNQEVSRIKVALTELLLVSLDKVLIHSDLCAKLINNGILPMLLRLLEDVICKCSSKYQAKNDSQNRAKETDPLSKTEAENLLKFVFGIGYSIMAFFHCLLMQCRSVDKLREFTDQFKLYGECLKGGLLKDCIELMIRIPGVDQEEAVVLIKKLIESIGKLVCGMKRVRSEIIHTAACPRTRHKMCRQRVAAGMHHHHDILGEASGGLPMSSACCVSVLYGTLTSLVTDEEVAAQSVLRNKILKVMLNCGVCCCFSPGALMESIVRLMLTHHTVASLCLQLLEYTVYGELGASVLIPKVTDQLPCSICEPCEDTRDTVRKYCPHGVSPIERKSMWSFLIHYNSLLQLDNHNNVLHATVSHLLRVTPKCRMEMKYELLFSVIYPTFIVAKHRYMIRLEESAYFLTVSCLNIFASLLNTVSFAEQFIQKGGLSYVLELVSMTEFSNQCCSILEIAIIVEIFKLMKENSELSYYREMSSLASVQMLFKSLGDMTDKFYKIYKLKFSKDKFEELCDVSKEREMLAFTLAREQGQGRKTSSPKAIKTPYATDSAVEESIEDYVEVLKNIWTFWKTCAGLCLYSPMFRAFVAGEAVFLDSYALLKLVLRQLCAGAGASAETRVLIKMLEALLTVQFAVSDVTSGRSKRTSCQIVRAALATPGALVEGRCGSGGGLRALCEALVRVATAHSSPHHTMPRLAHAKVPPLLCPSGSSSAECSSSEESVVAPYASEHSDAAAVAARPDEGYEADVEIGNLDIVSDKARKLSSSIPLSDLSFAMGGGREQSPLAECGEYARSGELAHPELCVIVVDILTKIIAEVVNGLESGSMSGEEVSRAAGVASGVARACAARLMAGAVRAPASPPLLRRLLGPAPAKLLQQTHATTHELQRSILELIHVLASQSIEPLELGALLKLFLHDRPPLGALLGALQRLVLAAEHNTPDCILTFPVDKDAPDQMQTLSEDLNHLSVRTVTAQSYQAEALAQRLCETHAKLGIRSAWCAAAARCGVEGVGWAAWAAGFALALWLRTHPRPQPAKPPAASAHGHTRWDDVDEWQEESCESESGGRTPQHKEASQLAHLVSLGNDSLLFETWLDTGTGALVVRVTRPEAAGGGMASEARVEGCASARHWTHLALSVAERVIKRRIHIQVTVFANGCELETVSLPLQGILVRKVTPTNVLIGCATAGGAAAGAYHVAHVSVYRAPVLSAYTALHLAAHGPHNACYVTPTNVLIGCATAGGAAAGAYHVAHVSVYRAPVLSAYTALHLAAHGPHNACYVRCESPNYPPMLTPNVLDSNIDWDQVYEMSGNVLRELHDNLLLTFSAHAPSIINVYHQVTLAVPTVFGSRGGGAGEAAGAPEAAAVRWAGAALPSRHRGLAPALYTLGGPEVLMYLYARVVELDGSPEEQATALGILLRASRVDNRLYAQLYADDALDMLLTVFASPKCHASHHALKVILEEACSGPVLTVSGGGSLVVPRASTALLEPTLLVLVVRGWKHFDRAQDCVWEVEGVGSRQGSAWALALACCVSLLRASHPRRRHNHYQATRGDMLRHLLLACKERFLNSDCPPLSASTSSDLVELVRGLMGSPPLLHHIALLTDFLLLMHQASDTFVTHSRANFYFLLTAETQEMSSFSSTLRRKASRRRRERDPPPRPSVSSASTDDDRGPDAAKQMKGIINTQIKENRKINDASSTSENSDPPAVEREQATSRSASATRAAADADLKEYIVVDVDDVSHTTVDVYTGGIYQQRRLRAGAEPGWTACEGLLLLLRDTIAVLPEAQLAQALQGAVSAECLLVLGNHQCGRVRAALVRVLAALTRRAPPDLARKLRHHHYLLHLANQISLYEGTWELAAACAALLTKCDVPLEDQLDEDIWVDANEEWAQRCPPLLALLPCCVRDVPLAHNVSLILRRLIDKCSVRALSEVCAAEACARSVAALGARAPGEGRALLMLDLQRLLADLALKALQQHHGMQTICDIHNQLTFLEETARSADARAALREAQVALFTAQLDRLEERLGETYAPHNKYANYFTTVISSAVSLGSESGRVDRAELCARHLSTVTRALQFLLTHSPHEPLPGPGHAALYDRLLATMLLAVSGNGSPGNRPRWGTSSGAEWAALLQEAVWWGGAPGAGARALQPRLLRRLYRANHRQLQPQDPSTSRKLAVYLLSILQHQHLQAEAGSACVELAITDWARGWAVSTQAALPERLSSDTLAAEAAALLAQDLQRWAQQKQKQQPAVARSVFSKEALCARLAESAMGVTRSVVEAQNSERKAFMQHLRRDHAARNHAATRWQRLLRDHTHDQAVWHEPRSYPQSWQLDPTEGPGRVRVRLRRAHLRIQKRFLKDQHKHKPDLARRGPPLHAVLGRSAMERDGLAARLQLNETVAYMARVTHVTVDREAHGELLLTDRSIHFVPEESPTEDEGAEGCEGWAEAASCWALGSVVRVATRRWCLQERALELFLSSGHAHLLAFHELSERAAFLRALDHAHLPNKIEADTLSEAMSQWRSGAITNWEYLMRLNGLGGRSYNDLMQYPVLPFVLADYTSRVLDLTSPAVFRELARPMAVQLPSREQHYINTYNDLKAARREGCSPVVARQPHHYASLYSNSGGVLHYLVRLPPFTELFLNYQDNNFDMPDRTFHSLATTWRLITNDSPTDVKEMIPELFYLPELFHNNEGLDLGVRQCGLGVDEVEVPPWAAEARLFVLLHRQALEAPCVTDRLPHWIDLVFGYKQTGQAAVDALNVFPACTYYGFDPLSLEDEVDRTAAAAMVRTYGQAPRQLLRQPHPHAARDLLPAPPHRQLEAWGGAIGVRWGRYCGSPELPPPGVAARLACAAAALLAVPNARAVAALPRATALKALPGEGSTGAGAGLGTGAWGVLSWGHCDNVLRLRLRRDAPPDLLMHVPALDQITAVSSSCSSAHPVIVGYLSGRVQALQVRAAGGTARARTRSLHAHAAAVTGLHVCARAALIATASIDGTIVLWDLNKLTYIRTLPNRDMLPVTGVTISATLCDVASVHETRPRPPDADAADADTDEQAADAPGETDAYERDAAAYQSLIRVHTVNARFVGSVRVMERVTCVCYSGAAEGVSVNVVAAGLAGGGVALYSSWDLRPVAHIAPACRPDRPVPLVSLTYSSDSSVLFGCYADGGVVAWESGGGRPAPRVLPAHALL